MVTLPVDIFTRLPVTEKLASPAIVELPMFTLILDPRTLTKALGLNPTSEKGAAAKGVAPKYMRGYLAVAGILLLPTNGASANAA